VNDCLQELRSRRILLALLVVPGFLIRAAVPPGFMPAAGHGAGLTMAMCTGHAAQSVIAHLDGGSVPADTGRRSSQHHDAPCVFAASAGAAPPPLIAAIVVVPAPPADVVPRMLAEHVAKPAIRAHAPRAPPLLV
jgi:hypothetical protein